MNNVNRIILKGVEEYCEHYPVELKYYEPTKDEIARGEVTPGKKLVVESVNEGGYNCTFIDAKQLYKALKEYFEKEGEQK